jgi:hypothetical protein
MTLLRFLAFLGLALWIGGLSILAGVGAPILFEVLQSQDPVGGRDLAGRLFGVMFERFQYVAWGSAAVLLVSLALRAALGPRPRRTALRIWTVLAMLAVSLGTTFVILPRVAAIRSSVDDGGVARLAADDARRVAFGQWHALSSGLMFLTLVGGLGLAWAEVRDPQ